MRLGKGGASEGEDWEVGGFGNARGQGEGEYMK